MRNFMNGFNPAQKLTLSAFGAVITLAALSRLVEVMLGSAFKVLLLVLRAAIIG